MDLKMKLFLAAIILTGIPGFILTIFGYVHEPVTTSEDYKVQQCQWWNCGNKDIPVRTGEEQRVANSKVAGPVLLGITGVILIMFGVYILHMYLYNMDFGISRWRVDSISNRNSSHRNSPTPVIRSLEQSPSSRRYNAQTQPQNLTADEATVSPSNRNIYEDAPPSYQSLHGTVEEVAPPSYDEVVHTHTTV